MLTRIFAGYAPLRAPEDGTGAAGVADPNLGGAGAGGQGGQAGAPAQTGQAGAQGGQGAPTGGAQAQTGTTLAAGATVDAKAATVRPDWPDDWRAKIAGDDEKFLKRLERYGSPQDLAKAYRSLETKLSSGEVKTPLPADATADQVKAWRKENGVPDKPEGFVEALKLPAGMVPGEADKPMLESFSKAALEANWTPAQFNQAVGWYYQTQDQLQSQRVEMDESFKIESQTELLKEWGGQFKPNLAAMKNMLSLAPEGIDDLLLGGRLANGDLIGNHPGFLRWMATVARELNPAYSHLPAGPGGVVGDLGGRIAELEKMMRENGSPYWRGTQSSQLQQEYRDLVTAREKMGTRTRAA